MRRRGCLIGVGGVLLSIVLCCALGWFVLLPRFHHAVEREMTTVLSTEVTGVIGAQVPDGARVEPGKYRVSLADLERRAAGGSDNLRVEGFQIWGEDGEIVMFFQSDGPNVAIRNIPLISDTEVEYRFTPRAKDGRLELTNMRGEGGIVKQMLAPEALGSAVENSVNAYLDANNLVLTEVYLDGDELVLVLGSV